MLVTVGKDLETLNGDMGSWTYGTLIATQALPIEIQY